MSNFEKKFGKYAIKNLSLTLIMCYAAGYLIEMVLLDVKSLCHYTWAGLAAGDVDFNTAGFFQLVFRAADALFLLLTWYVIGKDMGNLPL